MSRSKTIITILEIISTALSLTFLFVRTIGLIILGIYLIALSLTDNFEKPYQEQMYMGIGVVTLMVGIVITMMQIYFAKKEHDKLRGHERQLDKSVDKD